MTACPHCMTPGARVTISTYDEDDGRPGTVTAPMVIPASLQTMILPDNYDIIFGREDHVIVLLDAERGQTAAEGGRGGRGGKRICVPIDKVKLLDS